jgi:hypothetical protein
MVMSAAFSTAIIPTGKYFIALGSMDMLVYAYWMLILYFILLHELVTRISKVSYQALSM